MHYHGVKGYLFVIGTKIIKFKVKDFEIVATPLCLGNISEDFPVDNLKKNQDYKGIFMILVLIIMLLQLLIC